MRPCVGGGDVLDFTRRGRVGVFVPDQRAAHLRTSMHPRQAHGNAGGPLFGADMKKPSEFVCSGCGGVLPEDAFYRREGARRRAQCKECHCASVRSRRRARLAEDPGFEARLSAAKKAAKPDLYRAIMNRGSRLWRLRHPETNRAAQSRYRAEHGDKARACAESWRKRHPEWHRLKESRRRAQKLGSGGIVSESDWASILREHDHRCAYCGRGGKLEQDHVVPLSRGGGHVPENIVPACSFCNRSKGPKLISEWVPQ
jgi:5-methylcytosine-specific restriction endonuclease McrA